MWTGKRAGGEEYAYPVDAGLGSLGTETVLVADQQDLGISCVLSAAVALVCEHAELTSRC